MRNRRKKWSAAFISVGAILIIAAASLFAYNLWDNDRAYNEGTRLADIFTSKLSQQAASAATPEPTAEPYFEIDGNQYIGLIAIPALNVKLPVLSTWSNPNMKLAPCRYTGTLADDNLVILAHDYDRFFGRLQTLSAGTPVIFTDANGAAHNYTIAEIVTLSPTSIDEMVHSDYPLTLFTCTYGGQMRVTVRCVKAAD